MSSTDNAGLDGLQMVSGEIQTINNKLKELEHAAIYMMQEARDLAERIRERLEEKAQENPEELADTIIEYRNGSLSCIQDNLNEIEPGRTRDRIKDTLENRTEMAYENIADRANLIEAKQSWGMDYRGELYDVSKDLAYLEETSRTFEKDLQKGDLSKTGRKLEKLEDIRKPFDANKAKLSFDFDKRLCLAQKEHLEMAKVAQLEQANAMSRGIKIPLPRRGGLPERELAL